MRDFAEVLGDGNVTKEVCLHAMKVMEVDELGLDAVDKNVLTTIIDKFSGGPVGLETLASATGEDKATIEDVYEPYLIQLGFIARTPRGRVCMPLAYKHLGKNFPKNEWKCCQSTLTAKKRKMKTSDFYYDLPQELIAQTPAEPRDSARLRVRQGDKQISHRHFYDITDYLKRATCWWLTTPKCFLHESTAKRKRREAK